MPAVPRTRIEKTSIAKALAFLKALKVEVKEQKDVERIAILARKNAVAGEYASRIAVASKAQKLLNLVAADIRAGKLQADKLDGARVRELAGTGYTERQAQVVYQNTLRGVYNRGRWEQQQRDTRRKFLVYRTMQDSKVRPAHQAMNGIMLEKKDPFWKSYYPPCGHGCRCRVDSLTQEEYDQLKGLPGISTEPLDEPRVSYVDKLTGETLTTPKSIDPGFEGLPAFDEERGAYLLARSIKRMSKTEIN